MQTQPEQLKFQDLTPEQQSDVRTVAIKADGQLGIKALEIAILDPNVSVKASNWLFQEYLDG
jgi:hypothetical protein